MFEGFSDRARHAVIASQECARSLGHDTVRTEHLLLALASGSGTPTALRGIGATPDAVRHELDEPPAEQAPRQVALSDAVESVLTRARVEATILRHPQITPGHVVLALAREPEITGLMQKVGTSPDQVRYSVLPRLRCET